MTEGAPSGGRTEGGTVESPAPALDSSAATPDRPGAAEKAAAVTGDRPEVHAAAAFAGGLVLALLIKRVARG